jgi:hypothetical protein
LDPLVLSYARSLATVVALLGALLVVTAPLPGSAEPDELGGHDEAWWREEHARLESQIDYFETLVDECEESEAPSAYDGVDGYVVQGRRGRPRWVQIKRCNEERASLAAALGDLDRLEERARRLGVPPGWLR